MGIFDFFGPAADPMSRAVDRYFAEKAAADTLSGVTGRLFESGNDRRRRQLDELDIASKKRALGLPMNDDDYEDALNGNVPFRTRGVQAAFGTKTSNLIPEPGFLDQKPVRSSLDIWRAGKQGATPPLSGYQSGVKTTSMFPTILSDGTRLEHASMAAARSVEHGGLNNGGRIARAAARIFLHR